MYVVAAHLGLSGQCSKKQSDKTWNLETAPIKDRFDTDVEYEIAVDRNTPHLSISSPVLEVGGERNRNGDFHQRSHTMCDPSVPTPELDKHPAVQEPATIYFSVGISDFQGEMYIHSPNLEGGMQQIDRDHLYIVPAGKPRGRGYWAGTGGGNIYCPVVQMQLYSDYQPADHKRRRFADYLFDASYQPMVYLPYMHPEEKDNFIFGNFRGQRRILSCKGEHGRLVSAELALHLTAIHHKQNMALAEEMATAELAAGLAAANPGDGDDSDGDDSDGVEGAGPPNRDDDSDDDDDSSDLDKKLPAKENIGKSRAAAESDDDDEDDDTDDEVEVVGTRKGKPKEKYVWRDDEDEESEEEGETEKKPPAQEELEEPPPEEEEETEGKPPAQEEEEPPPEEDEELEEPPPEEDEELEEPPPEEDEKPPAAAEEEEEFEEEESPPEEERKSKRKSKRKNPRRSSDSPVLGTLSAEKARSENVTIVGGEFLAASSKKNPARKKAPLKSPPPKSAARKRGRAQGKAQSQSNAPSKKRKTKAK